MPFSGRTLLIVLIAAFSLGFNAVFLIENYREQVVVAVPDGDSLQLQDGRRVRLLGIDAPEKGSCLAEEARKTLELLTLGKRVKITDIVNDDYGRQLGLIFAGDILVQEELLITGMAKSTGSIPAGYSQLKAAADDAELQKRGIYSETCRPTTAPVGCEIKGNVRNSQKTYHLPKCKNYDQTIIDLAFGDSWFCTEQEAQDAGFTKATGC